MEQKGVRLSQDFWISPEYQHCENSRGATFSTRAKDFAIGWSRLLRFSKPDPNYTNACAEQVKKTTSGQVGLRDRRITDATARSRAYFGASRELPLARLPAVLVIALCKPLSLKAYTS